MFKIIAVSTLAAITMVAIASPLGGWAARNRAQRAERAEIVCDLVGCIRRGG